MILGEYYVKCPNCLTEVKVVAEMVSPILIFCNGCERSLVLCKNNIFTLPFDYVSELVESHNIRVCGEVLSTRVSSTAKELINNNKINELHHLLNQPLDVKEFINYLDHKG